MLLIVTLKRINEFQRFLAQYSWHNWPSNGASISHLTQHLLLHYLGKQNTNEICIEMDNKRQQMEIRSHKNLTMVVWTNEVHRLLTIVLLVKQRTVTRLADVRVSAGQCTNASGARNDRTVWAQNPRLHLSGSVALQHTALTSIQSSSGGHATVGLSDDVQECGWTHEATGWHLDWSGAEHYWHCYQRMEKPSACLCSPEGPTFRTFTVGSWTTGQLDKLSARVTEM